MPTLDAFLEADDRFNVFHDVAYYLMANEPEAADLLSLFETEESNFTWFLPTDTAFLSFARSLGYTGASDDASVTAFLTNPASSGLTLAELTEIIDHHVTSGAVTAASIADGATINTGATADLVRNGDTLVDSETDALNAALVQTDIAVAAGYVHVVDRVMLPQNYSEITSSTLRSLLGSGGFDTNSADYDIFRTFMNNEGLAAGLAAAGADLTLFAPTDGAFRSFAAALGSTATNDQATYDFLVEALTLMSEGGDYTPLLQDILNHHVVAGARQIAEVVDETSLTTGSGTIGVSGTTLVDSDTGFTNPTMVSEIQGSNGVLISINRLLLPEDLPTPGVNNVDFRILDNTGNYSATFSGNDWIDGNGGADTLNGGTGNDVVLGGTGNDIVIGYSDNDLLHGEAGNDNLNGGAGRDTMSGGAGVDRFTGGAAVDTFVYLQGSEADIYMDFLNGTDVIDVSDMGITSFDEILDLASNLAGTRVEIAFDEVNRIVINNFRLGQLDASDFIFAPETV